MRQRIWGTSVVGMLVLMVISSSSFVAQRPRNRPEPAAPAANDLKLKYRMTTSGQSMESTTMLKGARERSEMKMGYGMEIINITQCDLKRSVQISDKTRKYVVTPMETVEATASTAPGARVPSEPSRRGGVITYNINAVDTGERKEMFGFKARHVKTTMSIESSPDACSPMKQKMEMETTTMYGPGGEVVFSSAKEVVELSREPLDAALFDMPLGYVETKNGSQCREGDGAGSPHGCGRNEEG